MTPTVLISELSAHDGATVRLRGWVYQKRSSGKVRFLVLRDGTGYCQCVAFVKDVAPELFELCDRITLESSLAVTGTVRKDDRSPGGTSSRSPASSRSRSFPRTIPTPSSPRSTASSSSRTTGTCGSAHRARTRRSGSATR